MHEQEGSPVLRNLGRKEKLLQFLFFFFSSKRNLVLD